LISIYSAEENIFALDLANRDRPIRNGVWIGAKRNNSLNYFEWTNGQEFNYSNWGCDEPKHSTDPESHVAMSNEGTWRTWGKGKNGSWYTSIFICESHSSDE
jgi:hypothetical protein